MTAPTLKVWDILVRCLHWSLVASVVLAWLTRHSQGEWHETLGYLALAIVVVRACWGFIGTRYARFGHFVRTPEYTLRYARSLLDGSAPRYIGHNPLAGWMAIVLLAMVFLTCATGWLYTTDMFWGVEWVEELHEGFTNVLIGLVALHVLGAIGTSLHTRENLVRAMIHGRKRPPVAGDID
jgi:cytochrome b